MTSGDMGGLAFFLKWGIMGLIWSIPGAIVWIQMGPNYMMMWMAPLLAIMALTWSKNTGYYRFWANQGN